jgi:predicted DNA-binding WGR domain protein
VKQISRISVQDESADLIRIEGTSNKHRFYRCAIWPGLFGDVSLVREWGRIGQPGQMRLDAQPDTSAARGKMDDLIRRKERKGYRRIA